VAYDYRVVFAHIDRIISANPVVRLKDLAKQLQYSHPAFRAEACINVTPPACRSPFGQ
jgi:hypothetical protein